MKTFLQKKAFYKERQIVYDLCKQIKDSGEDKEVEWEGKLYKFYAKKPEHCQYVLIYSKLKKRPIMYYYLEKRNIAYINYNYKIRLSPKTESSVLIYCDLV